ncbi:MAG: HAD-IA family hydrolase [Roseburia sp.]|nr:HAD-IA family hydrolase [Roseburia sp.]
MDEGFREFAEKYSKIYAFCLMSNDVLEWSEFLTGYHRINHYFMDKIVSGEVHMRKPDKEIFIYSLKRLGCNPEQCIFIDNSIKNLLVAEELGIQTILFNRDGVQYEGRSVADFDALGRMLEGM